MNSDAADTAGLERRRQVLAVFEAALDRPEGEQAAWLDALYGGDPALVAEVEALLEADREATRMLPTAPPAAPVPEPLDRVGPYRLAGLLGTGGMGNVYLGERDDGLFDHKVAVKVMRPSALSATASAFFDTERRALARLRHRHIARLFDGGVTETGAPYFIMELIEGEPIDAYVRRLRPDARTIARLVADICDAVQHAHQNLVVHADIKPSNILVDAEGEAKLLDFGIAQLTLAGWEGEAGFFPRTPAFASPQRLAGARPRPSDDVYALGALLAALLVESGRDAGDELGAVAAMAQAGDPARRYPTAAAMGEDLRRWLAHRPVRAHASGWRYRARCFVSRNRWPVAAAAGGALLLVASLIVITALYFSAERSRAEAEHRFAEVRSLAQFMLFTLYDELSDSPGTADARAHIATTAREYLDRLRAVPNPPSDLRLDIARGYLRLATVQGPSNISSLGQPDQARRSLDLAEAILRQMLVDQPQDAEALEDLGWVRHGRWSLMADNAESPRMNAAAAGLFRRALAIEPGRQSATLGLLITEFNRGYDLIWADRPAEAVPVLRAVLRQLRTMRFEPIRTRQARLLEVNSLLRLGDATYHLEDIAGSLALYREAEGIVTRELARRDSIVWIDRLGDVKFNVSGSLGDMAGRHREALAEARAGVAQMQRVLAYGPDANIEKRLLVLYGQEAAVLSQLGDVDEAVEVSNRSIALREARLARQPRDPQRNRDLAIALTSGVEFLGRASRPDEACRLARRAAAQWQAIAARGNLGERDARRNRPMAEGAVRQYCRRT